MDQPDRGSWRAGLSFFGDKWFGDLALVSVLPRVACEEPSVTFGRLGFGKLSPVCANHPWPRKYGFSGRVGGHPEIEPETSAWAIGRILHTFRAVARRLAGSNQH